MGGPPAELGFNFAMHGILVSENKKKTKGFFVVVLVVLHVKVKLIPNL